MANGIVLYQGPSLIDGAPIVAIATNLRHRSENAKTGNMVQTWILRADLHPIEALKSRADVSICGGCLHRGVPGKRRRSCYVNVAQGPSSVWRAFQRGNYPSPESSAPLLAGKLVRVGSYGDPAAVPVAVWDEALSLASGWTGYTHQKGARGKAVAKYCQVSADSLEQAVRARQEGRGSFRVLRADETPAPFEMLCPASKEAGKLATCAECRACSGTTGRNVAIYAHGFGTKAFNARALPVLSTKVLTN